MTNKIYLEDLEIMDYACREAYNSLRSNLMFSGPDIKTILFTSCNPDEGKSTVSFGLARSAAGAGRKVLFVDTDLRKSVLQGRYQIKLEDKNQKGMAHYLSALASLNEVIVETNVENLYMILTGPLSPNPTELLAGSRMEALLAAARETFDMVIIDSPPLGMVIDAAVLAPKCDGVILVVESDAVSRRTAVKVKKQLEMTGCRIIGAVLNKIDTEHRGYYYGKYKYRYNKYYQEYK